MSYHPSYLLNLIDSLNNCYQQNYFGSQELARYENNLPQTKMEAYRIITLSEGAASENGLPAQFNWEKITQPCRSWSKSLEGALEFFANSEIKNCYAIIVKGKVTAFDIGQYCPTLRKTILEQNYNQRETDTLLEKLEELLILSKKFESEQEVIAFEVKDFDFIKSGLYKNGKFID